MQHQIAGSPRGRALPGTAPKAAANRNHPTTAVPSRGSSLTPNRMSLHQEGVMMNRPNANHPPAAPPSRRLSERNPVTPGLFNQISSIVIRTAPLRGIITAAMLATLTAPRPAAAGSFGFGEPKALGSNALHDSRSDWIAEVVTDGAGVWAAAWYSHEDINGIGTDSDVIYVRSENSGASWSAPGHLNSNAPSDMGNDLIPRLAYAPDGTWLAVWRTHDPDVGGGIGTDGDLVWSKSADGGQTWLPLRVLNSHAWTDSGVDAWARPVFGGDGVWRVFWKSRADTTGDLGTDWDLFWTSSVDNAETWTEAAPFLATAAGDDGDAEMCDAAKGSNSTWLLVWPDNGTRGGANSRGDFDILYARSTDNGETWTDSILLNSNGDSDEGHDGAVGVGLHKSGPSLATDRKGNWITVWSSRDSLGNSIGIDTDLLYAVSLDEGESWSNVRVLNTNAANDDENANGNDINPSLHTDGSGVWLVVWTTGAFSDPFYTDTDIAISRSTDLGETWTDPAPLNAYMATDFTGGDENARIVLDGNGGGIVVWCANNSFFGGGDYDVFYARSVDITLPPMPPLSASDEALVDMITDIVLGRKIADQNGDGVIDVADVIVALLGQ